MCDTFGICKRKEWNLVHSFTRAEKWFRISYLKRTMTAPDRGKPFQLHNTDEAFSLTWLELEDVAEVSSTCSKSTQRHRHYESKYSTHAAGRVAHWGQVMGEWDDKSLLSAFMDSWSSIRNVGKLISLAACSALPLVAPPNVVCQTCPRFTFLHLCSTGRSDISSLLRL